MALCAERTCGCAFQSGTITVTGDGSPEQPYVLGFTDAGAYLPLAGGVMDPGAQISFGITGGQHIVLFDSVADWGFGIQTSTMYSRIGTGASQYAWYQGGVHAPGSLDPGAGGEILMILGDGRFGLFAAPSDFWNTSAAYIPIATSISSGLAALGYLGTNGNNGVSLTSNGYRNASAGWSSLGAGGNVGGSVIELRPVGDIIFFAQSTAPGSTYPTERARIVGASGLILVGKVATSVSTAGVEIDPAGEVAAVRSTNSPNYYSNRVSSADVNGGIHMQLQHSGATGGTITRTGATTVAYNVSCDEDLKNVEGPFDPELAKWILSVVVPEFYAYKTEPDALLAGYIAQRVAAAWPGAIDIGFVTPGHGDVDLRTWDDDGNETTNSEDWWPWMMDWSKIIPVLHAGWLSQQAEIDELRADVADIRKALGGTE
jgi:hypothetical protein